MVRKGAMSGLFPGNYLEKVTPWQSSWKSVSCLCQLCFLYLLVRLQFYYFVINLSYIPTLIQTNQSNLSCLYNFKYFPPAACYQRNLFWYMFINWPVFRNNLRIFSRREFSVSWPSLLWKHGSELSLNCWGHLSYHFFLPDSSKPTFRSRQE